MMGFFSILAQVTETASETSSAAGGTIIPVDSVWECVTSLNLLEAVTFISFGAVCLLYGWRVFKVLVVISFGLLGLFLGILASEKINGQQHQVLGGLIGFGLMAVISVPLMRWAVSILGAVAGGIMTSGLWYACQLPEKYIWAGGLVGVVAGGMISFIIFRIAVMLFSSLGGSALAVVGVLALLNLYPQTTEQVKELFFGPRWFLPAALLIPAVIGVILQHKFIKGSRDWSV
jgi:hypothetical protein